MRKNRKRLSVDLPIGIHQELQDRAQKYNLNLTRYLLRIIIEQLLKERRYD